MANRLVIHFPNESINLISDDINKINKLSSFCKEELGAYHSSENIDELTVDTLTDEMSDRFHSILFELSLH